MKKVRDEHPYKVQTRTKYNIVDGMTKKERRASQKRGSNSAEPAGVQKSREERDERPSELRSSIVDSYIKSVLDIPAQQLLQKEEDPKKNKNWVRVIEHIYRLNMDMRILNNLRQ